MVASSSGHGVGPQRRRRGVDNRWERQVSGTSWRNGLLLRGNCRPLGNQKPIGGDAHRGVVVEAAPSTAFEMSKSDFLLELLIVALDAPAQLGEATRSAKAMFCGSVESQYLVGSLSLSATRSAAIPPLALGAPFVAMRGANPQAGKARAQRIGCAIAPCNRAPGPFRQAERQRLDRDWSVLGVAPHQLRRAATARPRLRRQRPPPCAHTVVVDKSGCVGQAQRCDVGAQRAVIDIAGVQQRHAARQPGRAGETQLLKRDLRLGLEHEVFRNAALRRRAGSSAHSCGKYSCQATGRLAWRLASDNDTATWQLSCLPS